MIDDRLAEPVPHRCVLPDIIDAKHDAIRVRFRQGTRFHCDDCAAVWVVHWVDWVDYGAVMVAPRYEWRRETRRERRQRLGLRWWQREMK